MMAFLIGTDEAGYGPNLGPLVISATVWEVPDGARQRQPVSGGLRRSYAGGRAERQRTARQRPRGHGRLEGPLHSGGGLRLLERGLWGAFALLGQRPRTSTASLGPVGPAAAADCGPEAGSAPTTCRCRWTLMRPSWRPWDRDCKRHFPRRAYDC